MHAVRSSRSPVHAIPIPVHPELPALPLPYLPSRSFKGLDALKAALADVMGRTFLKGVVVDPAYMAVLSGCSPVLDDLFYLIGEAGELAGGRACGAGGWGGT
jgi:hypothetical protein